MKVATHLVRVPTTQRTCLVPTRKRCQRHALERKRDDGNAFQQPVCTRQRRNVDHKRCLNRLPQDSKKYGRSLGSAIPAITKFVSVPAVWSAARIMQPQRQPYNPAARELTVTLTIEASKAKGPAPKAPLESPWSSSLESSTSELLESHETVDVVFVDVVVATSSLAH